MKLLFAHIIIYFLFISNGASAQTNGATHMNLSLKIYLEKHKNEVSEVRLTVKGDLPLLRAKTMELGGVFRQVHQDYASIILPIQHVEAFCRFDFIDHIEFQMGKGNVLNDSMLVNNTILPIHAGASPLLDDYSGEGIVLGFIDTGLDYTHPDFQDSLGNTRILSIWDQNQDTLISSRIPQPYGYGQVWDSSDINNGSCTHDDHILSHGTNVVGVAAGNGLAVGRYTGVAPETDLVMVASNFSAPDWLNTVADGVEYIFSLADSLNKPCVVNISAGNYLGSHDGSDVAALRIDSMLNAKEGRSLVCAAGNLGTLPFHLGYSVTSDTNFTWFKYNPLLGSVFFELWADTNDFKNVHFAIGADQTTPNFDFRGSTSFDQITNRLNTLYKDSIMNNGNLLAHVETYAELQGDKYLLQVHLPNPDSNQYDFRLMTTGSGYFDVWTHAAFGISTMVNENLPSVASFPDIAYYKAPDTLRTIVSSFACLPSVITVANYANRDRYLDVDSVLQIDTALVGTDVIPGEIAENSCTGPTRLGLQKPDVAATGDFTITANRLASIPLHIANNQSDRIGIGGMHKRNGGTSMASPVVAGIAALFLQKCPNASFQDIKNAIISSSVSDAFTATVPNMKWGNGKVNGFDALNQSNYQPTILPSLQNQLCDGETLELSSEERWLTYSWSSGDSTSSIFLNTTAQLVLTATDSNGCKGVSDSIFVHLVDVPDQPTVMNQGAKLYTLDTASSYQWYFNNAEINNATDSTYLAMQDGFYQIEVGNLMNCFAISDSIEIEGLADFVEENKGGNNFVIYPNPSTNKFWIQFDQKITKEIPIRLLGNNGNEIPIEYEMTNERTLAVTLKTEFIGLCIIQFKDNKRWTSRKMLLLE